MTKLSIILIFGFLMASLFKDPKCLWNRRKAMGSLTSNLEALLKKIFKDEILAGLALVISVVFINVSIAWLAISYFSKVSEIIGVAISAFVLWTTLSLKRVFEGGRKVYNLLNFNRSDEARTELSQMIGVDSDINKEDITSLTIKAVSRNIAEGIIAPLFYAFLGGPLWAVLYKTINVLYCILVEGKNNADIGYFSSVFYKAMNYIPQKISIAMNLAANYLSRLDGSLTRFRGEVFHKEEIYYILRVMVISSVLFLGAELLVINMLRYI